MSLYFSYVLCLVLVLLLDPSALPIFLFRLTTVRKRIIYIEQHTEISLPILRYFYLRQLRLSLLMKKNQKIVRF